MDYKGLLRKKFAPLSDDLGKVKREYGMVHIPEEHFQRDGVEDYVPSPDSPLGRQAPGYEVGYRTGSGNTMSLLIHTYDMHRADVPLLTEWEHVAFCGTCKGSSGGCPGFAPRFDGIKPGHHRFVVVTVSIDMIWTIMYATPNDGWLSNRVLNQLIYADRLTKNYCLRMIRHIMGANVGYPLGLGNCMGCKPQKCLVRKGQKCKHPEKRTYSMEAVGVDCDWLHYELYGEFLPWYYHGTSKIPAYMTRYIGIFPNITSDIVVETILGFAASDKSFIPVHDIVEPRDATISIMTIPSGPHKGRQQYHYNDPGVIG